MTTLNTKKNIVKEIYNRFHHYVQVTWTISCSYQLNYEMMLSTRELYDVRMCVGVCIGGLLL